MSVKAALSKAAKILTNFFSSSLRNLPPLLCRRHYCLHSKEVVYALRKKARTGWFTKCSKDGLCSRKSFLCKCEESVPICVSRPSGECPNLRTDWNDASVYPY